MVELDIKGLYELAGIDYSDEDIDEDDGLTDEDDLEGEKEQEFADPDEDDSDTPDDGGEEDETDEGDDEHDDDVSDGKQLQSDEDNSKYAAARRKAEAEAKLIEQRANEAVEAERKKAEALKAKADGLQAEIDAFYASQGMVNPYRSDKPIKTKAEYDEYQLDEAKEQLRQGNTDPKYIEMLAKSFAVGGDKQERKSEADIRKEVEADIRQKVMEELRIQKLIEHDMREIGKDDTELQLTGDVEKDFAAIMARPYGKAVKEQLDAGMTLINAFRVGAKDWLVEQAVSKVETATKAKAASKKHLAPPNSRGAGLPSDMPKETLDMYRTFFPKASDKDIREMWEKDQRKHGQSKT